MRSQILQTVLGEVFEKVTLVDQSLRQISILLFQFNNSDISLLTGVSDNALRITQLIKFILSVISLKEIEGSQHLSLLAGNGSKTTMFKFKQNEASIMIRNLLK